LGWLDDRWRRRPVFQGAVRPNHIVLMTPLLDDDLSFSQCIKDFSIQKLIPALMVTGLVLDT
jgi:hypothetical protein